MCFVENGIPFPSKSLCVYCEFINLNYDTSYNCFYGQLFLYTYLKHDNASFFLSIIFVSFFYYYYYYHINHFNRMEMQDNAHIARISLLAIFVFFKILFLLH